MLDTAIISDRDLEIRVTKAMSIVKRNMLWSAGAGVLPLPLIDFALITAIEVKMINELAELYGTPFRKGLAKSAVASLVGSLGSLAIGNAVALGSLRYIPVVGPLIALAALPGTTAAITYAIGKVFVTHFESGGTLLDFDPVEMRQYFRDQYAHGLRHGSSSVQHSAEAAAVV